MLLCIGVMDMVLGWRHDYTFKMFPIANANRTVTKIRPKKIECEGKNRGTEHHHQGYLTTEEKEEECSSNPLHHCTADREQYCFNRMCSENGEWVEHLSLIHI